MQNGKKFLARGDVAVLITGTAGAFVTALVFIVTLAVTQDGLWALATSLTCVGATAYSVRTILERQVKGQHSPLTGARMAVRPAVIFVAGTLFGAVIAAFVAQLYGVTAYGIAAG